MRRSAAATTTTTAIMQPADQEQEEDEEELRLRAAANAAALAQVDVERLPPRPINTWERRPRWCSRNAGVPISPHQLIDGRVIRSALLLNRRRRRKRELRFQSDEVAGCLEPENPWRLRKDVKQDAVVAAYKEACAKYKVSPMQSVIFQLKSTKNMEDRCEEFILRNTNLGQNDCEALEEVFRRILFFKVDLTAAIADDTSAEILFQIFEFYEATAHLDLSNNENIGTYGWQACSRMLRKTRSLKRLDAVNVPLNEEYMTILMRGFRYSYLYVLRLDSCRVTGRLMELLVIALKFNMALRQLYLCNNGIHRPDCLQLEILLKFNSRLSYLDLSNNPIKDDGLYYIVNGLTHQLHFGKESRSKRGLESLVLRNSELTKRSSMHLNVAINGSKTLKYLNVAGNVLDDDTIVDIRDSLTDNKVLRRLDLSSTGITCYGLAELATVLRTNDTVQMIDLRNNPIYKPGLARLLEAMEINKRVTELNIDETSKIKSTSKIKMKYSELVKNLQSLCQRNRELLKEEEALVDENPYEEDEEEENEGSIFGEDDLEDMEEPLEKLPTEYKRYMTWKI